MAQILHDPVHCKKQKHKINLKTFLCGIDTYQSKNRFPWYDPSLFPVGVANSTPIYAVFIDELSSIKIPTCRTLPPRTRPSGPITFTQWPSRKSLGIRGKYGVAPAGGSVSTF